MRNDARTIGEKLRDIDQHAQERGMEHEAPPARPTDRSNEQDMAKAGKKQQREPSKKPNM
jgi:hypothetical protein